MSNKFKVGQMVKVVKIESGATWDKSHSVGDKLKIIATDNSDRPYKIILPEFEGTNKFSWARECEIKLSNDIVEGSILMDGKYERTVLAIVGKIYFVSNANNPKASASYYTKEELSERGYELKKESNQEEIEELTMEEVCAKLGKTIKIKK